MTNVLIIGKHSYIGKKFAQYIKQQYSDITVDLVSASDGAWREKEFCGYQSIIMASAIVHKKETKEAKQEYKKVNCELPFAIAKKAKAAHVEQFIFLSSMAVFGRGAERITKETIPSPDTYYAKSKFMAEQRLNKLQDDTFKVVIVRPPMVYGENCPGNYGRLEKLANYMWIVPDTENKRSMIHIDCLCEELYQIIAKKKQGYFHVQDREYKNTGQIIKKMREEKKKTTYLTKRFNKEIQFLAKRIPLVNKVFGSLYYDIQEE